MIITEKYARINLVCNYNITPIRFLLLLEKYKNARNILADIGYLLKNNVITKNQIQYNVSNIHQEEVLVFGEKNYPNDLTNISDPPIALFLKGTLSKIDLRKTIALVGTRKISKYGVEVTTKLVRFLVENGFVIVSGMAYGIDSLVHELTLAYGGQTVAVLGTSVNDPYPQSNNWLYKKIINNNGLIMSESYFKQDYGKWVFPKRNRIIAGLCKKTIVIEAPKKSGALITANYAFDYDREVFSVPGSIHSKNSEGNHLLIKNNKANILSCYDELLDPQQLELCASTISKAHYNSKGMKFEYRFVYDLIKNGAISFEILMQKCHYEKNILIEIISYLDLFGYIRKYEDGTFMLK